MNVPARVLMIDDEPLFVEGYRLELELDGYDVRLVTTVDAALDYLATEGRETDCVVLDLMMLPGSRFRLEDTRGGLHTGVPVAKWVRQNHPHIVVIVLTNLADDEAARDLGGDITFLRKPEVLPFELAAQLRQRLAERGD